MPDKVEFARRLGHALGRLVPAGLVYRLPHVSATPNGAITYLQWQCGKALAGPPGACSDEFTRVMAVRERAVPIAPQTSLV